MRMRMINPIIRTIFIEFQTINKTVLDLLKMFIRKFKMYVLIGYLGRIDYGEIE